MFLHDGDMTGRGSLRETAAFAERLRQAMEAPGGLAHAIIVPGNHDECFETLPDAARGLAGCDEGYRLVNQPRVCEV